jgi:hypothetical protein
LPVIEAFDGRLDMAALDFERAELAETGCPEPPSRYPHSHEQAKDTVHD